MGKDISDKAYKCYKCGGRVHIGIYGLWQCESCGVFYHSSGRPFIHNFLEEFYDKKHKSKIK